MGRVVLKLGGSLLAWPGLSERLAAVLERSRSGGERPVLLVGGGAAADIIRDLDRIHGLDDVAHRLAVRAMEFNAAVAAALVPGLAVIDDLAELDGCRARGSVPVLAPGRFLDADDARPDALAHSWAVTSDAIAARLAVRIGAEALVLLKSAPIPAGIDAEQAARLGLVDPAFPTVAAPLPRVALWNLRDAQAGPVWLGSAGSASAG